MNFYVGIVSIVEWLKKVSSICDRIRTSNRNAASLSRSVGVVVPTYDTADPGPIMAMHVPPRLKIVLVGETSVGKTCMVLRFCRDIFADTPEPTIGAAYVPKTVSLCGIRTFLNLWDTGGHERYDCLVPLYYRDADGAVIVYDITSQESFLRATRWVQELRDRVGPHICIALAGNKVDKEGLRQVASKVGQNFANENHIQFYETSAKTDIKVTETFMDLALTCLKLKKDLSPLVASTLDLQLSNQPKKSRGGCAC